MDLTTVIGIVLGIASLVIAFVLEGGSLGGLLAPTAAIIVFGGTIGATIVGYSLSEVLTIPKLLGIAFKNRDYDVMGTIETIVQLGGKARREGILGLESEVAKLENPFLRQAIQLIIDITDMDAVRSILEQQIYAMEQRHAVGVGMFEAAGGYAPTMGILGTVMGLVHVLGSLSDPSSLGPAIAVAFLATLYGVASANLLWLPIAAKLKNKSQKEKMINELIMEGALAIYSGRNPTQIRTALLAFVKGERAQLSAGEPGATPGEVGKELTEN